MAIDNRLQVFNEEGQSVDYDILASDVKFLPDGKDLPTKLAELEQEIEDAGQGDGTVTGVKVGSTTHEPTEGVVDLSEPFNDKVDKETGKELIPSTDLAKLQNLPTADQLSQQLSSKANDNAVVKSISVNGQAPQTPQNGNVNIQVQAGEQVSVIQPDPADGTFIIRVGSTDYTINLNHTHPNMAKLIVCEESDLPSTLDPATIYAITDSGETEIEKLIIRGMEFAGGGVPDTGEPMISSPSNGSTINLGDNTDGQGVSKVITIKGKNLTGDLTVAVGTGLTLSYGQQTGQSSITIPQTNGVVNTGVTVAFSGSGTLDDGSLVISHGGSVLSSVVVVVEEHFPSGYTKLSSISDITNFITTNINAQGTTWEIDASAGSQTTNTELLINYGSGSLAVGTFAAGTIDGKWGLGGSVSTSVPKTQRSTIAVAFTASGVTMTIGNETISREASSPQNSGVLLFGRTNAPTSNYLLRGTIYSVKCTAGGSFNGVPAKRTSDNKEGIYDLANDVFYLLK